MLGRGIYKAKYIWEFDYKGMFNNISHDSVIKMMHTISMPKTFIEWSTAALKTKPNSFKTCNYNRNEDQPYLEYEKEMRTLGDSIIENYVSVIRPNIKELRELLPENPENLFKDGQLNLPPSLEKIFKGSGIPGLDINNFEETSIETKSLKLLALVEDQMSRGTYPEKLGDMFGKELMNNLEYTHKGMPQGLGPSPFWSCLVTKELEKIKDNIIMYMDDGLLFAETKEEMDRIIEIFRECSRKIGVEINEGK
jgi:hypothetical protein